MAKDRILLKLSGGNLKSEKGESIFSHDVISHLADQIKELSKDYSIAIVIGGGNIFRGIENTLKPLDNQDADTIGMLATMMNGVALQNYLKAVGVSSTIFSALSCPRIAQDLGTDRVEKALNSGEVVIFSGGTGLPYLSTDTCSAIRALEVGATKILIGKNGVKGVYTSDPSKDKNAEFIPKITYEEVIQRDLRIMDLPAMFILKEKKRPKLIIFNQCDQNAFVNAIYGKIEFTEVY